MNRFSAKVHSTLFGICCSIFYKKFDTSIEDLFVEGCK